MRPRTHKCKQIEYELQVPRSGTYIMKPTEAAKQRRCGQVTPPFLFCSAKRDKHIKLKESEICL